ncbi:MAG: hypothetical protein IK104_09205 [Clostridia bacterium]|nr:hypothetical protein [Clostridia bacterium]
MAKIISFFLTLTLFFSSLFGTGGDVKQSRRVSGNDYASAGYSLTKKINDACFDRVFNTLHSTIDGKVTAYVWPAASFAEMLTDAYRLFPGNTNVSTSYRLMLKRLLPSYLVKDAVLTLPSGETPTVSYYNVTPGASGDYYYDDNEWVCIELLLGYQNLGDKSLLKAAETNLAFLWTGWDDHLGGGLYWSKDYFTKNTCSNAPGVIAFALGYQCTGNEVYLTRAKMIYDWVNDTLGDRDGMYWDAISTNGIDRWKGAYNQATMIYSGALLYELTGDETYYENAKKTVAATLPHIFEQKINDAGETVTVLRQNPIFTAWCIGWLMRAYVRFYEVDPAKDTSAMDLALAAMKSELATKDEDGLYDPFFCSGGSDPGGYNGLLSQCGVATSLLNVAYYDAVLNPAE